MRNFRYIELITNNQPWDAMIASLSAIQSDCLRPCAEDFQRAMNRSATFALLPLELCYQTARNTRMTANAIFNDSGKGSLTLLEHCTLQPTDSMALEFAKEAGEHERMGRAAQEQVRITAGFKQVNAFMAAKEMQVSMDVMLTSITLEAWLYFEVLCAELWAAGVDHGGAVIAARIASNQSWEKDRDGTRASADFMADLPSARTHPGSFRRELGMVNFQKLWSIKQYYKIAFGDTVGKVFSDSASGYIRALSEVRHCIMHRGGRFDSKSLTALGGFPEWASTKPKDELQLDGEIVKKLRNAALETGLNLVRFVDACLRAGD